MITRPALIPSSYLPNVGGVERVAYELASGLPRHGMAPVVFTNRWPKSSASAEYLDGVEVHRFAFRVPHRSLRGIAGWLALSASTSRSLVSQARDLGCDLVNVHCVSSNAEYALAVAGELGVPLVVSMHGELTCDAANAYFHDARLRRVWTKLLDAADHITAPSAYSLAEAEAALGRAFRCPSSVVHNGVDLGMFGTVGEGVRSNEVLAVGRLVRTKGFHILLEAWDALPPRFNSFELIIAGDGPDRQSLTARAERMSTGRRVRFLGRLESHEVAARLACARLFVLPSRAEAQPLTVLEAMAAGTPIVATRVGGVPELMDEGKGGLLLNVDDVGALTAAISAALDDGGAASDRAGHSRDRVATMTWASSVDGYRAVYETAAAG